MTPMNDINPMNRTAEWHALLAEQPPVPPRLEHTVQRARARHQSRRRRHTALVPLGGVLALALCFIVVVNSSMVAAHTIGQTFLGPLARAVAFSPSLKAAVDNAYVQPVGQSQTGGGVTMAIEYLIVDSRQVNIFYTVSGAQARYRCDLTTRLEAAATHQSYSYQKGELEQLSIDFMGGQTPGSLSLSFDVFAVSAQPEPQSIHEAHSPEPEALAARFDFDLTFDPYFTAQGAVREVNQWVELSGQRFLVGQVAVYPTQVAVTITPDPENTAQLVELEMVLHAPSGQLMGNRQNGMTASGDPSGPHTYYMETSFFEGGAPTAITFTHAIWLDADTPPVTVDLPSATAENLPPWLSLSECQRQNGAWRMAFRVEAPVSEPDGQGVALFSPFSQDFYDSTGKLHRQNSWSSSTVNPGDQAFEIKFTLRDFPGDTLTLHLNRGRWDALDVTLDLP